MGSPLARFLTIWPRVERTVLREGDRVKRGRRRGRRCCVGAGDNYGRDLKREIGKEEGDGHERREERGENHDSAVVVGAGEQEGGGVLQSWVRGDGGVPDRVSRRWRGGEAFGGRGGILGGR